MLAPFYVWIKWGHKKKVCHLLRYFLLLAIVACGVGYRHTWQVIYSKVPEKTLVRMRKRTRYTESQFCFNLKIIIWLFTDGMGTAIVNYNKRLYIKERSCSLFWNKSLSEMKFRKVLQCACEPTLVYRSDLQKWVFWVSQFSIQFSSVPEPCR